MSGKLPTLTAVEILRALRSAGWYEVRQRGSHVIMRHDERDNDVIVPYHRGKDIPTGTLHSIIRQTGMTRDEFREFL